MVLAIIVFLMWVFYPRLHVYYVDARNTRTLSELASFRTIMEAYASGSGNGHYPKASNNIDDPSSIATVLQERGIMWGSIKGVRDPWGNPYRYYTAPMFPIPMYPLSYAFVSAGADGVWKTDDDIWATDWDPPVVDNPEKKWFASGNYPYVESVLVLENGEKRMEKNR